MADKKKPSEIPSLKDINPAFTVKNLRDFLDAEDPKVREQAQRAIYLITNGYINGKTGEPTRSTIKPEDTRFADMEQGAKKNRSEQESKKQLESWEEYDRKKAANDRNPSNPPHPNLKPPTFARPQEPQAAPKVSVPSQPMVVKNNVPPADIKRDYYTYVELNALSEAQRKELAKNLNTLGANVPTNGVVGPKLIEAVNKFQKEFWFDLDRGFKGSEDDYMALRISEKKGTGSGSGGSGGGSKTSVFISDTEYDAKQLQSDINTVYRQALGREATAEEIAAATKAINAGKGSTTTTTSSVNKKGQSVTTQLTRPGVDAGQVIQDQAKANPEFGSFQAATTYFDGMLNVLNGTVGRGA